MSNDLAQILHANVKIKNYLNYLQRFSNYIKCHKDFNTLRLYTLKALLSKSRSYFFFLILWHTKVPSSNWNATLLVLILHLVLF